MSTAVGLPVARPQSDPTIRVQIPAGVAPGSSFVVRLDTGEQFAVSCPAGSRPGDYLDIIVPHREGSGAGGAAAAAGSGSESVTLSKAQVGLAGAGAAAGLLLAGPITAVALAGAGAYAASKDGAAGATAKEFGKKAFDFGTKAAAMAKEKLTEAATHVAAEAERRRQLQQQPASSTPVAIAYPVNDR